jgi:hypothetical protein
MNDPVCVTILDIERFARADERDGITESGFLSNLLARGRVGVAFGVARDCAPLARVRSDVIAAPEQEDLAAVSEEAGDDVYPRKVGIRIPDSSI